MGTGPLSGPLTAAVAEATSGDDELPPSTASSGAVLMEIGDYVLMETGDRIALEQ